MAGIVGYGAYIPRNRIKVEEIAKVWGADAPSYKKGLMLEEKSVPRPTRTRSPWRSRRSKSALKRAGIDPREIGAVYVGSESHPYAVKPCGTVLAEASARRPTSTPPTSSSPARPGPRAMFVALSLVKAGRGQVRPGRRRRHLAGRARRRPRVLRRGRRGGLHLRQGERSWPRSSRPTRS